MHNLILSLIRRGKHRMTPQTSDVGPYELGLFTMTVYERELLFVD